MHTMRMAIILAAVMDVILVICLVSAVPGKPFSERITVTNLTENSGTDKLTLDIQTPVLSGFEDEAFEKGLNLKIKTQIDTARKEAEEATEEFWQQAEKDGYEPWPFIFFSEYEVKSNGVIFSLRVTTLLHTGGTGMPHTVYYNADTKKNKLILLSDLFRNGDYIKIINSVILKEMDKDIERYVPPGEFPGVSKYTKFFISEGKLYITFAKYEVASGMTGEPEFLIPTERIRGILKKEYKDIFI